MLSGLEEHIWKSGSVSPEPFCWDLEVPKVVPTVFQHVTITKHHSYNRIYLLTWQQVMQQLDTDIKRFSHRLRCQHFPKTWHQYHACVSWQCPAKIVWVRRTDWIEYDFTVNKTDTFSLYPQQWEQDSSGHAENGCASISAVWAVRPLCDLSKSQTRFLCHHVPPESSLHFSGYQQVLPEHMLARCFQNLHLKFI